MVAQLLYEFSCYHLEGQTKLYNVKEDIKVFFFSQPVLNHFYPLVFS